MVLESTLDVSITVLAYLTASYCALCSISLLEKVSVPHVVTTPLRAPRPLHNTASPAAPKPMCRIFSTSTAKEAMFDCRMLRYSWAELTFVSTFWA